MADEYRDPKRLTFSQAQGYEEIPSPLSLGELSNEARVRLWDTLALNVWRRSRGYWYWKDGVWLQVFHVLHSRFWVLPLDEFPSKVGTLVNGYKTAILSGLPINEVFDLFQMIMRHKECPGWFTTEVAKVFRHCRLAYVVDTKKPPTILPAATKAESEAILAATNELRRAGLQGAEAHLRKAGELINYGDWAGSVRESVNAIESVARSLDADASKTLEPALRSLERSGRLHPALKEAFTKLYGYTSDEEGIRHALLDNPTSPAGRDEAVFMLGACASFASYLWRRSRKDG